MPISDRRSSRRSPPAHLSAEGAALGRRLYRQRIYNEDASIMLLTSLGEAHERECREALEGQPMTIGIVMVASGFIRFASKSVPRRPQDHHAQAARVTD